MKITQFSHDIFYNLENPNSRAYELDKTMTLKFDADKYNVYKYSPFE